MSEPQYDYSDMPDPIEQRDEEIRKLKGKNKSLREALKLVKDLHVTTPTLGQQNCEVCDVIDKALKSEP